MKVFISILFAIFFTKANAQHKIDVPEFANINLEDKYPERSILATYTNTFDILISLNSFSAWGPDHSIKMLAHHQSGWWKVEINTDPNFVTNTTCLSSDKIVDSIGDILWNILKQNHLFNMKDDRQILSTCITTDTLKYKNGKFRLVEVFHDNGLDGIEYKFEIITKTSYKKLYFYSPQDLVDVCPPPERRWILNCVSIFEKYLGK